MTFCYNYPSRGSLTFKLFLICVSYLHLVNVKLLIYKLFIPQNLNPK